MIPFPILYYIRVNYCLSFPFVWFGMCWSITFQMLQHTWHLPTITLAKCLDTVPNNPSILFCPVLLHLSHSFVEGVFRAPHSLGPVYSQGLTELYAWDFLMLSSWGPVLSMLCIPLLGSVPQWQGTMSFLRKHTGHSGAIQCLYWGLFLPGCRVLGAIGTSQIGVFKFKVEWTLFYFQPCVS